MKNDVPVEEKEAPPAALEEGTPEAPVDEITGDDSKAGDSKAPIPKEGPEISGEEEQNEAEEEGFVKKWIVGDYDYGKLCKPRLNPWKKEHAGEAHLQFIGPNDVLPALVAGLLGFQHSLAVVGGTVIPGILIGNQDPSGEAGPYLVSYALITSGKSKWYIRNLLRTSRLFSYKPRLHLSFQVFVLGFRLCIRQSQGQISFWEAACSVSLLPHSLSCRLLSSLSMHSWPMDIHLMKLMAAFWASLWSVQSFNRAFHSFRDHIYVESFLPGLQDLVYS